MSYFCCFRLVLVISVISLWWRTLGAPVNRTIRPISDERYHIIYDIISGTRTFKEKSNNGRKNAARMIRRWRKKHHLSVANCLNPLTAAQEKATMRAAIFGSSYVKVASSFTDFVLPFEVGWF
ncbi:uncharacterized protein LOC134242731 [Saccostrea cucullata]|uniref:uncharacterized protein LOC134242731 n=1 Tax=Saccostrea cuccullata TaxID=36930 RepID=UPI002ED62119